MGEDPKEDDGSGAKRNGGVLPLSESTENNHRDRRGRAGLAPTMKVPVPDPKFSLRKAQKTIAGIGEEEQGWPRR